MGTIRLGMSDVVVGTVLFVAGAGVAMAAVSRERETANRIRCATNLKQIGQAILLYSNENRNAYPRTTASFDAPPTWGTPYGDDAEVAPEPKCDPFANEKTAAKKVLDLKPKANDVTAAMFLLVRTQDLVPNVFVCPSTRGKPLDYAGGSALGFTNFPGKNALARSLNYSYQNPYATKEAIGAGFKLNNSIAAEFAVAADMNPGSDALLKLRPETNAADTRPANSLNHGGDGQNVLFGDGHVEFVQSPLVGIARDNIYVANDANARGPARQGAPAIVGSSVDANDSALLPTAADLGQNQPLAPVVASPDDAAAAKVFAGTYSGQVTSLNWQAGRPGVTPTTLTLGEKTIRVEADGQSATYDFTVAGTRGTSLVLALHGNGAEGVEAELSVVGSRLYIDSDEPTGLLKGDGGAGRGWSTAQR